MKKISLVIGAALFSSVLFAQTQPKFGLKAGLNVANLNVENVDDLDSRLGLNAGLLAHIHLSPQWGIQPELVYSQQGMKVKNNTSTENDDVTWKVDYVNIPVMVQYMFDNGFRLQAGPQIGLLVNGKIEDNADTEIDIKDDLKKVDAGLGLGLGYLTYSGLGIEARYNLGLSNINESGNDIKNRVFQVGLFYMFDQAHKAKSK